MRLGTSIATAFALLPGLKDRLGAVKFPDRSQGWLSRFTALRALGTSLVVETARLARSMDQEAP